MGVIDTLIIVMGVLFSHDILLDVICPHDNSMDVIEPQIGGQLCPFFMRAGWGVTHDGVDQLIVSDGSEYLLFWSDTTFEVGGGVEERCACALFVLPHSNTFSHIYCSPPLAPPHRQELRRVAVVDSAGNRRSRLNELEFVHGWVFANVWQTNSILIINPATGLVVAEWDCSALAATVTNRGRDVLNGIAYSNAAGLPGDDSSGSSGSSNSSEWGGRFWITGKLWDRMFEVEAAGVGPPARRRRQRRAGAA